MSSSSVITQAVQGLATATSPGLVGTGAQTWAGKKTLDGGALIKGDTSGIAIATGYVGETKTWGALNTLSTITTTASRLGGASSTITLDKGNYLIFASGYGAVPTNIAFSAPLNVVSGAATMYALTTTYSSPMNDSQVINNYNFAYYVLVTQDSTVFEFLANVSPSGSYTCRLTAGRSIRIA